jgi:hypothetical protein
MIHEIIQINQQLSFWRGKETGALKVQEKTQNQTVPSYL